jgi:hypothetical protein
MSDQDASESSVQGAASTSSQPPQDKVKPKSALSELLREINRNRQDPANVRLWLYEVLLEEYDSLGQPALLEADIEDIRKKLKQFKDECEAKKDEAGIEKRAEKYNAELTSMIYRSMRAAQVNRARMDTDKKRLKYAEEYQELTNHAQRQKVIDRAVVADIYGTVQDLSWKYEQEHADIEDEAERKAKAYRAALEELKVKALRGQQARATALEARPDADKHEAVEDEDDTNTNDGGLKHAHEGISAERAEKIAARGLRSALCLSGGGIRSATFNLGILQGLARHGLLENFTYLSTVSGGGFIGSWLTAWIHRRGTQEVVRQLRRPPKSPIDPDPKPISHLRTYSNYLSPKVGMLSADTWTLIATLSRNMVMTWLVFIPGLMAFLMLPRIWAAFILRNSWQPEMQAASVSLLIGSFASIIALSYIGVSLPSTGERNDRLKYFLGWSLIPLVIASISLATYWVRLKDLKLGEPDLNDFIRYQLRIIIIPWIVCVVTHLQMAKWRNLSWRTVVKYLLMVAVGTCMIGMAQAVSGYLMWLIATRLFNYKADDTRLYAAFAVPLIMLLFAWAGTLIAGFTSRFTEDADQEWWARAGAWLFIVMFGWTAVCLLVLYGPSLLTTLIDKVVNWRQATWSLSDVIKLLTAVGAIISGIITLAGGFSAKTPANEREAKKSGLMGKLLPLVTSISAVIFFAFIIILIALGTNWLLASPPGLWLTQMLKVPVAAASYRPGDHRYIILHSALRYLSLVTLAIIVIATILGWLISSNKFSLHYMWRNRLIRAYLGASDEKRNPNLFTEFDEDDNVQMHELQVEEFHERSFRDAPGQPPGLNRLLARIKNPSADDDVSIYIKSRLSPSTKARLCKLPRLTVVAPRQIERALKKLPKLTKERLGKLPWPLHGPVLKQDRTAFEELTHAFIDDLDDLLRNDKPAFEELARAFINDLNDLLRSETLYDPKRFARVTFSDDTKFMLEKQKRESESSYQLNRRLLEDAYPAEIKRSETPKPFHVVNIALNLTGSDKLSWQDRRAESFTVSPLHAGSFWPTLGYRRAKVYGRRLFVGIQGISLGTAAAISGAFVSPNMGYMMSSPVVRFIMTLFNVRFGWWLGNPGRAGARLGWLVGWLARPFNPLLRFINPGSDLGRTFDLNSPRLSVMPILYEAFGQLNDKSPYVYLSDGGHFENLGLYEMVLRRCRVIVVSDASTDADYSFQSLAMSIRQIRVDLGVPIEIQDMSIGNPSQNLKGKYCAAGRIRYSCVDRDPKLDKKSKDEDFDGILIYIKPSLIGGEPRDVVNYGQGSPDFPQEVIVDQWFSEAQFESYRMLGSHIIDTICGGSDRNQVNFASFARKVREHNQLDFMAFQEQINYAVLEEQFKTLLPKATVLPSYQRKVKNFIKDLLR